MSMFDNIVFDEFTLLEGEQAEAYKKRKEEERYNNRNIKSRNTYGYMNVGQGYKTKGKNKSHKDYMNNKYNRVVDQTTAQEKENNNRLHRSIEKAEREVKNRQILGKYNNKNFDGKDNKVLIGTDVRDAADAINRHERRHSKNESGIFSKIDFI